MKLILSQPMTVWPCMDLLLTHAYYHRTLHKRIIDDFKVTVEHLIIGFDYMSSPYPTASRMQELVARTLENLGATVLEGGRSGQAHGLTMDFSYKITKICRRIYMVRVSVRRGEKGEAQVQVAHPRRLR